MKEHLRLFFSMLRVGLFTFGGGYAMIALLESTFVEREHYLEREEFLDVVAIAESTPGPIAINAATYIGFARAGLSGATVATLGMCLPSFVILFVISLFLDAFLSLSLVAYAFRGIQVGVLYLIFSAGLRLWKQMKKTPLTLLIFFAVLLTLSVCSLLAVSFSTVLCILLCGAVGLLAELLLHPQKGADAGTDEGRDGK